MIIETAILWAAATNTYVVAPEPGGLAVVIDAPPDPPAILELLARHDLTPAAVLLTHGHIDHMGGAGRVAAATGAPAFMHADDDFLIQDPDTILRVLFGIEPVPGEYDLHRYELLEDKAILELAGLELTVVHTPGHTPGHCCFVMEAAGVMFSGDQLFAGSIGRTDLPGGDFDQLMDSMRQRVLTYPDETDVLPGHGPRTTIGRERRSNPFLRALEDGGSAAL